MKILTAIVQRLVIAAPMLVPLVSGIVLLILGIRRRTWRRPKIAIGIVLILVGLAFEFYLYVWAISYYPVGVDAGIQGYYKDHEKLPETLEEIREDSGSLSFRGPLTGFHDCFGSHPIYLKANQPGMVVAIIRPTWRMRSWRYLTLKDADESVGAGPRVTEEELATILAEDDRKRAEAGEPGRWADINWRD
jgi:hypothetical protein